VSFTDTTVIEDEMAVVMLPVCSICFEFWYGSVVSTASVPIRPSPFTNWFSIRHVSASIPLLLGLLKKTQP
jgi:hypothetical protein